MNAANRYPYVLGCQLYLTIVRALEIEYVNLGVKTPQQAEKDFLLERMGVDIALGEMTGF